MGKTLVNIISHQAIPNYLFIKEFYKEEDGDKLLFFTTKSMESAYGKLKASLNIQDDNIEDRKSVV